jgi:hypothetical protein
MDNMGATPHEGNKNVEWSNSGVGGDDMCIS